MGVISLNKSFNFFKSLLNHNTATVPAITLADAKPEFIKKQIDAPFNRVTPESQGVASKLIYDFLSEISNDKTLNMHNIIILKNGKVIAQTEFGNSDLSVWKMTFSACKSIVSLAIGMLVDDEKLDINTPISEFFPEYVGAVAKIKLRDITVETLLNMSTGSSFNEFLCMTSQNWEQSFIKSTFSQKAGQDFNYNSLNTYMLSAIVKRVSGECLTDFLKKRLFTPLGISNYYFEKCPTGIEKGGWGFYIMPEDFAKIGQLVLNKGIWQGKRIISENWINTATSKHISTPEAFGAFDYGYQFWVGRETNIFLFNGMFGQNILGFRNSEILIVSNAGNGELFQQSNYFKIALKYFSNDPQTVLPENRKEFKKLQKYSASLSFYRKKNSLFDVIFPNRNLKVFLNKNPEILDKEFLAASDSAASVGILPQFLQITQNNYSSGLKSVKFQFIDNNLYLVYTENCSDYRIPLGVGKYQRSQIDINREKYLISAAINVSNDEDFDKVITINIDFIETFSKRTIKIYFKNGKIILKQSETPGMNFLRECIPLFKNSISKSRVLGTVISKTDDDFLFYKLERIFEPSTELSVG